VLVDTDVWPPAVGGRGLGGRDRPAGSAPPAAFKPHFWGFLTIWMCPAFTDYTSSQEQCLCWLTRMCGPQL